MTEEIITKLKHLSNLENCQSASDMQDALEDINDLLNEHYPQINEGETPNYKFVWPEEFKEKVIGMLDQYFDECGNSECIAQADEAQIRAAEIMCQIADVVNPIN